MTAPTDLYKEYKQTQEYKDNPKEVDSDTPSGSPIYDYRDRILVMNDDDGHLKLGDVVLSEKQKYCLHDPRPFVFAEGTTNSGKSFVMGLKMIKRILTSPKSATQFVLAGKSVGTLERMYIQNMTSFYNLYSPICTYKKMGIGGSRIEVKTAKGIKVIYLVGYDNARRWQAILGMTIAGMNIEEINIGQEDFIREAFLRADRNNGWMLSTCNGASPALMVYKEYLNVARPLERFSKGVPASTWKELKGSKSDPAYAYYFFTFRDNPTMDEGAISNLIKHTPPNSFLYTTKILGERGVQEGTAFAQFMTTELIIPHDEVMKMQFEDFAIGVDVGAVDYTVFILKGFTKNFNSVVNIDRVKINKAGSDDIYKAFKEWFTPYYYKWRVSPVMYIDPGGGGLILHYSITQRLRDEFNIFSKGAYKYSIKKRVEIGQRLLYEKKLLFSDRCTEVYNSYADATLNPNPNVTDIRMWSDHKHKDDVDAAEYGEATYIHRLIHINL